jgi:hypothetical protein
MIRWQAGLVDTGLEDFEAFRLQMRHGSGWVEEPPAPVVSETPETQETEDGSYGPGPGHGTPACELCTPAHDGSGPGPGPGPSNQGDITRPDDGYGPLGPVGTPACEACTPAYGEHSSGPKGTTSSPGSSNNSENGNGGSKGK